MRYIDYKKLLFSRLPILMYIYIRIFVESAIKDMLKIGSSDSSLFYIFNNFDFIDDINADTVLAEDFYIDSDFLCVDYNDIAAIGSMSLIVDSISAFGNPTEVTDVVSAGLSALEKMNFINISSTVYPDSLALYDVKDTMILTDIASARYSRVVLVPTRSETLVTNYLCDMECKYRNYIDTASGIALSQSLDTTCSEAIYFGTEYYSFFTNNSEFAVSDICLCNISYEELTLSTVTPSYSSPYIWGLHHICLFGNDVVFAKALIINVPIEVINSISQYIKVVESSSYMTDINEVASVQSNVTFDMLRLAALQDYAETPLSSVADKTLKDLYFI